MLYKYHDAYKINSRGIVLACTAFPRFVLYCFRIFSACWARLRASGFGDGLKVCRVHPVPRVLHLVPDWLHVRRVFWFRSRLLSSGRACGMVSSVGSVGRRTFVRIDYRLRLEVTDHRSASVLVSVFRIDRQHRIGSAPVRRLSDNDIYTRM